MFDPVHDTQAVHRALVKAFSFPGHVVSIAGPSSRCEDLGLTSTLAAVALTLLDAETSFYADSPLGITERTGAIRRPVAEAAFLLCDEADSLTWTSSFARARRGTLADPHEGATIVVWATTQGLTQRWTASGPGIEEPLLVELPGDEDWVQARNRACIEFPLGVDWIWARDDGGLMALPRTTRLVPVAGKGD